MNRAFPDDVTVRAAVSLAAHAPSVHNSQPWQWRLGAQTLHLFADSARRLTETDPSGRDMVVSCGAMLHHVRVALAALGWQTRVHRLPNPDQPDHLAAIETRRREPNRDEIDLSQAITVRRSDRRWRSSWPVTCDYLNLLNARAGAEGVVSHAVTGAARHTLLDTLTEAAGRHAGTPEYRVELAAWSGRHATADGVLAASSPAPDPTDPLTGRAFSAPRLPQPAGTVAREDSSALLLLTTASDDRMSWLRAGEATSAVLLMATTLGLATCPITEPLELPDIRARVRAVACADDYPQMIIRVGWVQVGAAPLPATPRRPVADILAPLGTGHRDQSP